MSDAVNAQAERLERLAILEEGATAMSGHSMELVLALGAMASRASSDADREMFRAMAEEAKRSADALAKISVHLQARRAERGA